MSGRGDGCNDPGMELRPFGTLTIQTDPVGFGCLFGFQPFGFGGQLAFLDGHIG